MAASLDAAIAEAPEDIATLAYGGVDSLYTQMQLWIAGIFSTTGVFPPANNGINPPGQTLVTDWYATNLFALADIEGPLVNNAGVIGTSAVINAVVRTLSAVVAAIDSGDVSSANGTLVLNLYNSTWT